MAFRIMSLLLLVSLCAPLQAQDENMAYVRDMLFVVLRDAPGDGAVVRSGIPSGTAMVVLEERGENTRVRLEDGYTGWISTQYLDDQPAARTRLAELEAEAAAWQAEREELLATAAVVQQLAGEDEGDVDVLALQNELSMLRQQAERFSAVSEEREKLLVENVQLQDQLAEQEARIVGLQDDSRNAYFLRGAGAVLLGVLIALVVPALKPKKRNEWA